MSTPAHEISTLAIFVLAVTTAIFAIVSGLLTYSVIRFRSRRGDDGSEPPQIYGSAPVEFAWTAVPVLIVFVLILVTARSIYSVQAAPRPPHALAVRVVGHQWWWEFQYPELGVVTANELHVPVSDPRDPMPTFLELESADVAHSFWVPRLAGKTDLIPNKTNVAWIDPQEPGVFPRTVRGVLWYAATAFYHSALNFTTLGYGDIVMSRAWRLLGPLSPRGSSDSARATGLDEGEGTGQPLRAMAEDTVDTAQSS